MQQVARFWRRRLDLRVIGITGSVGKSSTKETVAGVLGERYRTLKNPGNMNNEIGLPLTLLRLSTGHEVAVLEMGFYVPGEIALLCDLALPQVGVITNVGTVHAERAGSQEAIARGKAELVQSLPPAPEGTAILNYDDPWVREMALQTRAQVFFYGMDSRADLWADEVDSLGLEGIRFRVHYRDESIYLRVPLIGRHSVHTALRAAAVGLVEGLTWQEIVAGLHAGHTQLRLVAVRGKIVPCCWTIPTTPRRIHPGSAQSARGTGWRKVAVLGDMLELGTLKCTVMRWLACAAEVVDELVTVGERGRMIAAAARSAGLPDENHRAGSAQQAIEFLSPRLDEKDVVLVKGSHGMRMDHIVAALEYRE
jgi:UDP-N-acetylmuramoyl-tripeptide--D-alanyl-D-alanine ligase